MTGNASPLAYILIADDDPLVLKSIRFILERADFPVRTAVDGREALEMARRQKPALALLDVMMPELDGLDVCRAMKSDPALRDVPIFLVTARAMAAERQKGLEAGADDYITKPFVNRELIDKVRTIFDTATTG